MTPSVYLCLALHHHQPVGSSEPALEAVYQRCCLPFLDQFESFERLSITLHTSGPLLLWLAERHPDYLDRLRTLIEVGRLELLGGPHYEAILPMLAPRDRIGQIQANARWIQQNLGVTIRGIWIPAGVWESSLVRDLTAAGIAYTIIDDSHFRAAGLKDNQLRGYFLTESDGVTLRIFPNNGHLQGLVRHSSIRRLIDHCWRIAQTRPGATLTLALPGEPCGLTTGPQSGSAEEGWMKSLFQAIEDNRNWLHARTLAVAVRQTPACGRIYLPDGGQPELHHAALPSDCQRELASAITPLRDSETWETIAPYVRAGDWRNLRVKYDEANELYARTVYVSRRLRIAEDAGADRGLLALARDHLYRGQSSGPFHLGPQAGLDLPRLRQSTYHHLIRADALLDEAMAGVGEGYPTGASFVEAIVDDFNFDLVQEVRLANDQCALWLAPGRGGRLQHWDLREQGHNLLATLRRCPELTDPAITDRNARHSMLEHFFDDDLECRQVINGTALERGDFLDAPYEAKLFRAEDRVQLRMQRMGQAWGTPISITKAVTLHAGSDRISMTYLLENLPPHRTLHFGIEFNLICPADDSGERLLTDPAGQPLGTFGDRIDLQDFTGLSLRDQALGARLGLQVDRQGALWSYPVETIARHRNHSEQILQGVCLIPRWYVRGDDSGRWAVKLTWRMARAGDDAERQPRLDHLQAAVT